MLNGFTFLVLAYLGCPVKKPLNGCRVVVMGGMGNNDAVYGLLVMLCTSVACSSSVVVA